MPFINPLNYLLSLETRPDLRHGQLYSTTLNPLFLSYNIDCKPEYIRLEKAGPEGSRGYLIFDTHNKSPYPLFNYSCQLAHIVGGEKVRDWKFDAPYLAPDGGNNNEISFKTKWDYTKARAIYYLIKGYVKGLGHNQNVNKARTVPIKR